MRKKFAITLICLTTILYGAVFFISRNNGTGFLEEINCQLMRLHGNLKYAQQVDQAKGLLKMVLNNENPPSNWNDFLEEKLQPFNDKAFYFFKIWMIDSHITADNIEASYPVHIVERVDTLTVLQRFPGTGHVLQFNIFTNAASKPVFGLFLPINNSNFSADYNYDDRIDYEDVLLARKRL